MRWQYPAALLAIVTAVALVAAALQVVNVRTAVPLLDIVSPASHIRTGALLRSPCDSFPPINVTRCEIVLQPADPTRSLSSVQRTVFVVPRTREERAPRDHLADAQCWAVADVAGSTLVVGPEAIAPPLPSSDALLAATWAAGHTPGSPCDQNVGSSQEFKGIAAFLPGLVAAVAMGQPTIAVVSRPESCSTAKAPGVIFPTGPEASMLPIVPLDQFGDALSAGRDRSNMLYDVQCHDLARAGEAPVCKMPPPPHAMSDADWQGGLSQRGGWIDHNGVQIPVDDIAGRHFISAARVASPPSLTLCSVPVVAAVQWGLCQSPTVDDSAANPAPWLSSPLDDQATPLVLPVGVPPPAELTAPGGHRVAAVYGGMAVHSTLAWALLPVVEPGLGHGVAALLQAVLALYGHAAVILPPGRLCGLAPGATPTFSVNPPVDGAEPSDLFALPPLLSQLVEVLVDPGRPTPAPWPGGAPEGSRGYAEGIPPLRKLDRQASVADLLGLAVESSAVRRGAGLSDRDARAVRHWLEALGAAGFAFPPVQPTLEARIKVAEDDTSGRYARTAFAGAFAGGEFSHIRMSIPAFVHMARTAATEEAAARGAAWWAAAAANRSTPRSSTARKRISASLVLAPLSFGAARCRAMKPDSAAAEGAWSGVGAAAATALSVPLPELPGVRPYLRHCVSDGAHMRDIVKVTLFRRWSRSSSPDALAALLRLYAPAFPLLLTTEPYITVNLWNALSCITSLVGPREADAQGVYQCAKTAIESEPGHLGYLVSLSDSLVLPWNTRRLPADRLWVPGREAPQQPAGGADGDPDGSCWDEGVGTANATRGLPPRLRAAAADPSPADPQPACPRADAFYVPGRQARDAVTLISALRGGRVGMRAALRTLFRALESLGGSASGGGGGGGGEGGGVAQMRSAHRPGSPNASWAGAWSKDWDSAAPLDVGRRCHFQLAWAEFEAAYAAQAAPATPSPASFEGVVVPDPGGEC